MMRGVLVLGTDTGVGKTVVSTLLLAGLRKRGLPVSAMKPVETGCDPDPLDAMALVAAAAIDFPIEQVCPYRFRLPAAPEAAARVEGAAVEPTRIRKSFDALSDGGERFVVVEGAGGAGTPYGRDLLAIDLATLLDLQVLLVARAALGTIGQSLVALRAIRSAGAKCAGVVLCRVPGDTPGPEDPTNAPLIQAHSEGVPVLGTLPLLAESPPTPRHPHAYRCWADAQAGTLEQHVRIDVFSGRRET